MAKIIIAKFFLGPLIVVAVIQLLQSFLVQYYLLSKDNMHWLKKHIFLQKE